MAKGARSAMLTILLGATLVAAASAEEPPRAPGDAPPGTAKPGAAARPETVALADLRPREGAMPEGVRLIGGTPGISVQPRLLYEAGSIRAMLGEDELKKFPAEFVASMPAPVASWAQGMVADGGRTGTVYAWEYAADARMDFVAGFMRGHLWGPDGQPTPRHPEELHVHGTRVFVLSFRRADPAGEAWKAWVRARFRIPMVRTRPEMDDRGRRLQAALAGKDVAEALRIAAEEPESFSGWADGQYLLGEALLGGKDHAAWERACARAVELHETLADPLTPFRYWAAIDGLGNARLVQRKLDSAITTLRRAEEVARESGVKAKAASVSTYNLACAYSLAGRFEECVAALRAAIAGDPAWRGKARTDTDFDAARDRDDFRALLAGE